MNRTATWLRLLALLVPLLVCGCVSYRPRLLKYDDRPVGNPAAEAPATLTVTGDGVLVQAREGDPWRPVRTGDSIATGALILTGGDGSVTIELPGGHGQINVAPGTTLELARVGGTGGALLVLTAGKVSGTISGAPIELISSSGGSLSLNPNEGVTAPFELRHGRDAEYFAVMQRLGLRAEWGSLSPMPIASLRSDFDLIAFRTPVGTSGYAVPEPKVLALLGLGLALMAGLGRKR
jgi:hypothetical protein